MGAALCAALVAVSCATAGPAGSVATQRAVAPLVDRERAEDPSGYWIQVAAPSEGELLRSKLPLIELRGRVGRGTRGAHDVVIAIDQSQSSLLPTGLDLDGDGIVGTMRGSQRREETRGPYLYWTTDVEDIVVRGEIAAARRLLATLDPERARVAVLSYSGKPRVRAPLGSVADAHRALDEFSFKEDYTGSDLGAVLRRGGEMLADAPPWAEQTSEEGRARDDRASVNDRLKVVALMVSDGVANAPRNEQLAAYRARRSAEQISAAGVRVYAFEIKNEDDADPVLLDELTKIGDGRHVYVDDPNALAFELPDLSYARVERVEVRNVTARSDGRAVRVFPGGSFDAFVPLVPGENHIRVEAVLPDGQMLALERVVYFIEPQRVFPSDSERMEAMRDALRDRTLETQLPKSERRPGEIRSLEVEVEPPGMSPPDASETEPPSQP